MRNFFGFSDNRQLRDYLIMCLCIFAMCASLGLTYPLLTVIMERRGVSSTMIGLNAGMVALAFLLMSPVAGFLAHRVRAKTLLYSALAASSACILLFKVFDNMSAWFGLRFVFGTTVTIVFVVSEVWLTGSAPDRTRGRLISLYGVSLAAGFLVGTSATYITGYDGWAPFIAGATLLATATIPLMRIPQLSLPRTEGRPASIFKIIKTFPIPLWGAFAFGAIELGTYSLVQVYGLHAGLSVEHATGYLMALIAGNIVLQLPLGLLADKVPKQQLLLAMALVGMACCLTLPAIVHNAVLTVPVMFILGGLIISIYIVSLSVIGEQAKGGELIGANAAMNSVYGLAAFFSPWIVGLSMERHDPHGYAYAITALFGLYTAYLTKEVVSALLKPPHAPANHKD